jgi:hypothetical protein
MHLKFNFRISKKNLAAVLVVLSLVGIGIYTNQNSKTPVPDNIKNQASFKVIYPSSHVAQIDTSSFLYQEKEKALSFSANFAGTKIVFTEQNAPESLGSDTQAYYPALGIHPYAQFKTKLGQVALTKFWQSATLKPQGQSAVLASSNTFLIAHASKDLTNQQWKELFETVKIDP